MEGQSTYPASALNYAGQGLQAGSQRGLGSAPKVTDRPMTEMESVSAGLGDLVRRLSMANDDMAQRLDRFIQSPEALGRSAAIDPEPAPGTIGSIKHLLARLETEVNRASAFERNLSGVI